MNLALKLHSRFPFTKVPKPELEAVRDQIAEDLPKIEKHLISNPTEQKSKQRKQLEEISQSLEKETLNDDETQKIINSLHHLDEWTKQSYQKIQIEMAQRERKRERFI